MTSGENTHHQYNLDEPKKKVAYRANREGVAEAWNTPDSQRALIGSPPPLCTFAGRRRSPFDEFCPFLEPGSNWTQSQTL